MLSAVRDEVCPMMNRYLTLVDAMYGAPTTTKFSLTYARVSAQKNLLFIE
jgi:hypothetical protein